MPELANPESAMAVDERETIKTAEKRWLIMLYLAGDNNLSEDMAGTVQQLGGLCKPDSKISKQFAVTAFFDGSSPMTPSYYCDFSSENPVFERQKEANSADPKSIIKFAEWSGKRYKSEKNVLFLSGHSDGFHGLSLLKDENSNKALTLDSLRKGLEGVKRIIGKPLDILCFDSCVMSMTEVAF